MDCVKGAKMMDYGFFDDVLKEEYPNLFNELHSEQGNLSVELLSIRISTKLDAYKFANLLGMELEDYLEYEFGNTSIPISKFHEVILNARKVKNQIVLLQKTDSFLDSADFLKMLNDQISWKTYLISRFTDSLQSNRIIKDKKKSFWNFDFDDLDFENSKEEDVRFNVSFNRRDKLKLRVAQGGNTKRVYTQSQERTIINV